MRSLKLTPVVIILLSCLPIALRAGEICLTFERLPYMEPLLYWTPREVSTLVLRELENRKILSIGFVQEEKLQDTPSSGVVLLDWAEKGHLLGNGTFAYADFNELEVKEFLEHVADGQKSILQASRVSGKNFRYLRFPSMHFGNTEGKRERIAKVLFRSGYVVFPATVLPHDYEFNWAYRDYVDDEAGLKILKGMYLEYMMRCMDYAEKQSQAVFGREIPQVIRLHLGIATARFLPVLLDALEQRGYTYIPPEKTLENPVFQTEEHYIGPLGLSFTDRVAAYQGKEFDPDFWEIDRKTLRREVAKQLKAGE